MSYIVLSKQPIRALVTAARNLQGLMDAGTIGAACPGSRRRQAPMTPFAMNITA